MLALFLFFYNKNNIIYVNYAKNEIRIDWASNCKDLNNIYFTSEEIAKKALEKFGDRIKKLYMDMEED